MRDNTETAAARAELLQATIAYIESHRRLFTLPVDTKPSRRLSVEASRAIAREDMDAAYDRLVASTDPADADYIEGRRL